MHHMSSLTSMTTNPSTADPTSSKHTSNANSSSNSIIGNRNSSLSGLLESPSSVSKRKGGAATVGGDYVTASDIYIRPDGKKVRRMKKVVSRNPDDANSKNDATNTTSSATTTTTSSSNSPQMSEVYVRPDGKKVRRILRPKTTTTTTSTESGNPLGNFLSDTASPNNNNTPATFRGSATVVGASTFDEKGEIYIRADGKKVRRIKKSSHPDQNHSNNNTTPNNNNHNNNSSSNNSIATTITNTSFASTTIMPPTSTTTADHDANATSSFSASNNHNTNSDSNNNTIITKSEIYINAQGKKVRRVIKQKIKEAPVNHDDNSTTTAATAATTTKMTTPPTTALSGFLDQTTSPSFDQKPTWRGSASVDGAIQSTTTTTGNSSNTAAAATYGEVYINAQGKKVRRVLKPKSSLSSSQSVTNDPVASSSLRSSTNVGLIGNNNKSNTIAEGEIYIRADGKKVRRVKRSSSNVTGGSSAVTVNTPTNATNDSNRSTVVVPPPPPLTAPLSPLDGFLVKHSPKRTNKATIFTGSATVAGDIVSTKIDGGEVYINAQGKKVRRVRKAKPMTASSAPDHQDNGATTTPTATTTAATLLSPTETTIANARTHLGVTQSILLERAAAKIQKAEQQQQQSSASPPTHSETGSISNHPPTTPFNDAAVSTNDTLDTPTHTSLLNDDIDNNKNTNDAASVRPSSWRNPTNPSVSATSSQPRTDLMPPDTSTTTTAPVEEKSEIYINADGKKVRRVRRSASGSGSNRSMDSASNNPPSLDGQNNGSNDDNNNKNTELGEIYIRPDGKKVRRVRRHQSTDSALGIFLQDGSHKPTRSGSATVVGDRKLDGEIIIRPDGKKVIRRAKSLMTTTGNSITAAGDISTPPIGEIFRNADGKLVRRVKRTVSKDTESLQKPNSDGNSNQTVEPTQNSETPLASTTTVSLTDDEETIANGYRKMKNMGIPDDAVRHKMTVSEVHPKIIAAVMGEPWVDSESTTTATTQHPSTPTASMIQLTTEEEAVAAVYRKMQKMGLPPDAVRHKMIVNEVTPKIVAAVLGGEWKDDGPQMSAETDSPVEPKSQSSSIELTGGEEMIASVYRKLQKMGLPDDAVRHKMVTSNVHPKIIAAVLNEEWIDESKENEVAPNSTSGPTLTSEEEEVASPFRKMQKIGFSNDAVRHKMIMSEVHPKIMAAVLGEPWTDDSTPATESSTSDVTTSLTSDEEAIVAPYKRMMKAGIPVDSVRHKMTLDCVDTGLIAKLLGDDNKAIEQDTVAASTPAKLTEEEELLVSQYRKMRRMGLPDDAVRHKMIVNEVDPKIISAFFNEEQHADTTGSNDMTISQPVVANATPKASGAVAYVVVVGDEEAEENTVPASSTDQLPISLNPEEKFAVKVADEANPDSTSKQTKFYTLDELARLSGQSKSELEAIVKEKRQRGLSPPKFSLQPLQEQKYEVSVPLPSNNATPENEKPTSPAGTNVTAIKEGQEVVDSDIAKAARAVSALADGDMSKLLEKLKMGDMKDLLEKLYEAEKRQKKLEKQLAQAGVAIAEDIDYQEALNKVGEIAKRMNEIGGSDVVVADKAEQNRLREEYFKLEQEMERYNTALVLSEEYQAEQDRLELKWEADNEPLNMEALKKIRRHMPVNIRHLSEADLTTKPSPNGKYLPVAIAKKFKRTNILQCLRLNPDDLECMHPATLENMRVTGLTLTERRALYIHFKPIGPKWEKNKAEKMTERKWTWYQMMRNNFKENVAPFQRHIDQYGGPENHTCPLIGKQCPIRADKNPDYDGDYGWTENAEYEVSDVRKADVEDSGAKAKAEALELTKAKKANERADLLKKHYKGKLLQVSKANGSCEGMDEAMDQMENSTFRWTENMLEKGDKYTDVDKKKEVANFMDTLNEFKLKLLAFAQRSGMQMSGKKTDGGDSTDIRSLVEGSLSEELFEASNEYFTFIRKRLKSLDIVDTRCIKTIEMLEGYLADLHGRNTILFEALGAKRMNRSRKLKTNKDIQKEVEEKNKPEEPEPPAAEAPGRPGPPMGGGGRGGLMDAIAGRGRGRGGGRGGLLDAISGRGRGRGDGGGRGGLLDAIAGRGRGGADGGRGGLLDAIAGRGRGRGGDSAGGRGGLLDAIAGRGRGGGDGGGRGGLLAAIAARGGGGD